jgi:predicted O-linked N-acetylglucosamine transferase (SPINDLY family)
MNQDINSLIDNSIKTFKAGNFKEAKFQFLKILNLKPNNFDILYNIGIIFIIENNYHEALNYLKKAININPNNHFINSNLGLAFSKLGNDVEAIKYYSKALKLKPDYIIAYLNFGKSLSNLKKYNEALHYYNKAIKLNPIYAESWCDKGVILNHLKSYEEALFCYDQAIKLKPNYAEALSNKGITLYELKSFNKALNYYNQAIKLKPNYFQIWFNKALALNSLKFYNEALVHYDQAIKLKPDYAEAWSNKGDTLGNLNFYEKSLIHYNKAIKINPDINYILGRHLHTKMRICDWSLLNESINNCVNQINKKKKASEPFQLLSLIDDPNVHLKSSKIFVKDKFLFKNNLKNIFKIKKKKKIKIAYFSADFRNHPVSLLTAELFELHDRNKFEVIAFSFGLDDKSAISERLRKCFDIFINVIDKSDLDIVNLARKMNIDIAIDLMGFTKDSRTAIFAYRCAPIQVNWLGYPGTLGAKFIDYIISDKIVIPKSSQKFYVEKVFYLPHTFLVDDSKRIPSSRIFTKQECNLPENSFIFCSFANDYKFNEKVLDNWCKILCIVKNSVLWISEHHEKFKENIKTEFESRGINFNRIIFSKREELIGDHLKKLSLADLFLDTYPYNSHATAIDALKAGVPVITLIGKSFASRVASSLLCSVGLPELITNSTSEYEKLAINLATNNKKLTYIKNKLSKNILTKPLFNTKLFVRNLESAYIKMYKSY